MIAQELEVSLHMAFVEARQKRHEFITIEHLLRSLLDNPSAAKALRACGANIEKLRRELTEFIDEHTPVLQEDKKDAETSVYEDVADTIKNIILQQKRNDVYGNKIAELKEKYVEK